MDSLRTSSALSLHLPPSYQRAQFVRSKPSFLYLNPTTLNLSFSSYAHERTTSKSRPKTALSTPPPVDATEQEADTSVSGGKFDWYAQWYPVMPLCDLDKRRPHAKCVLGMDLVVWWDRNEDAWKVMEDACPHRLAPLSEGRIDQWGRLQCVYHGWCFNGSGDCKFIPQAPVDGPPVHTFKQACVSVYPTTVQHDIVWFWPNSDPQYRDIITRKKPPYMPELDDPSFTKTFGNRDISYGYEVLIENLMDPSHVPYAHYGLMQTRQPKEKNDREGGKPHEISIKKSGVDGYLAKQEIGRGVFYAPCIFYANNDPLTETDSNSVNGSLSTKETENSAMASKPGPQRKMALIFMCVPVSPGKSRLIWVFPRNFGVWIDQVVPRWLFHIGQNLILDSDLYLLHVEERRIAEIGGSINWQKACFVPTKADTLVVGFRKWLNNYAGGEVDWRGKFSNALPSSPPKEQLMDRYWTHTVNCSSCNAAYKYLNILEVVLQIVPVALLGLLVAMKETAMSRLTRSAIALMAVLCFAASRWLAHFVHRIFHYHDYDHAFV